MSSFKPEFFIAFDIRRRKPNVDVFKKKPGLEHLHLAERNSIFGNMGPVPDT